MRRSRSGRRRSAPAAEVLAALDGARVPAGPIFAVDDMLGDEHYVARGMFEEVALGSVGGVGKVPALCPRLERGRGRTQWAGPELGEHTREVLEGVIGMSATEVAGLLQENVASEG